MSVLVLALVACSHVEAHLTYSTSRGSPSKSLRAHQPSRDGGHEDAWSRRMLEVWTAHEKSNATEILDDPVHPIDEFRGELCFKRLSLVAHPTCMKWLVKKCKRGSGKYHGSGLCNKLERHVKHRCIRGDEAACDYARQLGMNPDGWDRHHPEGAEAVKASPGEDDVVEDENDKAEGGGAGSGSHHGGGAGQNGEGGSGWPKWQGAGQDGDAGASSHDSGRNAGAGSHGGGNNDGRPGASSHRGGNAGSSGSAQSNTGADAESSEHRHAGADANSAGNVHSGKSASAKNATASGSSINKAGDGGGSGAHDHDHRKHHHDQEDSAGVLSLRMITIAVVTLGLTQV